ncbi:MAG: SAM-dependent methyltransferase [Blastocatellia bacterium]
MSTELEQRLIERVKLEGPITFRDFMHSALYEPELGYYNTERLKIGAEGDYYTSSNVHHAFGAVLARAFAELWADFSEPLTIVELGSGTGQLAFDVLSAMRDEHRAIFKRLRYSIVEASPRMRELQTDNLSAFADRIQWSGLHELERSPFRGIAFSNEFVDAMPVHRARHKNDGLQELYLTTSDDDTDRLAFVWDKPSTKRLEEYFKKLGVALQENQIVEINLDAIDWLEQMARVLRSGFLITIDYGDLAGHLWTPNRMLGTLRSFYRHRLIESPLDRIGQQDLTASVNFTALIDYGRDLGIELVGFERQTAFLTRLGLIERIATEHSSDGSLEDLKQRLAVKNLFVPGGVSDSFQVLVQQKAGDQ